MLKCLYDCASLSYIINNRTCERLLILHGWHLYVLYVENHRVCNRTYVFILLLQQLWGFLYRLRVRLRSVV